MSGITLLLVFVSLYALLIVLMVLFPVRRAGDAGPAKKKPRWGGAQYGGVRFA
jgi:hypothetical protein